MKLCDCLDAKRWRDIRDGLGPAILYFDPISHFCPWCGSDLEDV